MGSLIIGETAVRIYNGILGKGGYIWLPDSYLGRIHAPNSRFKYQEDFSKEFLVRRRTNHLGLVGKEISIKKPDNVFRILILGDSFTEGLHVNEGKNFCEQLQYLLDNNYLLPDKHFEVINAGMSSFSPISEYLFLKRELLKLNPDMIILQLFANDVFEDNKIGAMSIFDDRGLPIKINRFFIKEYLNNREVTARKEKLQETFYKIKRLLVGKSVFFRNLIRAKNKLYKKDSFHKRMVEAPEYNDYNQFFIIQDEHPLFKDVNSKNRVWGNTKKYILAIRDLAREEAATLFMFYIPPEGQLKLKQHRFYQHKTFFPCPVNYYLNEKLKELSEAEGIGYLDLTVLFEANKYKNLYYRKDGHTNEIGHSLIAKGLFDYLKEKRGQLYFNSEEVNSNTFERSGQQDSRRVSARIFKRQNEIKASLALK